MDQAGVVRRIARSGHRRIGFVPLLAKDADPLAVSPVVEGLAAGVTGHVPGDVAFIPSWKLWKTDPSEPAPADDGAPPRMNIREIRPRLVRVMPPPSPDTFAAGEALGRALELLPDDFQRVLIDLGGYAERGEAPPMLWMVDAVVLIVARREVRLTEVEALAPKIPERKRLGAILLG
jgi:hypothetical protein